IWSAKVASLVCHGAVASAPGGFLEGRCLRMAPYVTGTGAMEETTAPPEDANVGYPLGSARSLPRRAPDRATSSFPLSSPDLHCQAGCHHWVLYWIRDRGVGLSSFVFRFGLSFARSARRRVDDLTLSRHDGLVARARTVHGHRMKSGGGTGS